MKPFDIQPSPAAANGTTSQDWVPVARSDQSHRLLALCVPGDMEKRLRQAAHSLGQEIMLARSYDNGLDILRERAFDVVVVALADEGAGDSAATQAREFVRSAHKINREIVVVLAAPGTEYEQFVQAMVEGAYDFVPENADDRQLRLMLGRALDHSRLRRRSGQLERALDVQTTSLRRRLQELAMLNEMAEDMNSVPDLDVVLERALRRTLEAFGSECGSFMILNPAQNELVVRCAAGPGADRLIGQTRVLGEGVSGAVAREQHPVLVTNIETDSRFKDRAVGQDGERHYASHSFLAVPIIHHGRLLGELNVGERTSAEPFTQDDLRLLSVLAGHVASAINSALAAEELKQANQRLQNRMHTTEDTLRDTTERLTRAEQIAHAIVSSLPAAVAAFDDELRITFANKSARVMLGLEERSSLKGHPSSSDLSTIADAAVQIIADGSTRALTAGSRLDGCSSNSCIDVVVAPLHLPDGSRSGGTIIATPGRCPMARLTGEERNKS
jgi:PAS domain-containing protein